MTEREPLCECSAPGFCSRYQLLQDEYAWGICSAHGGPGNRPCSMEKSERYRKKWRLQVIEKCKNGPPPITTQIVNLSKAITRHVFDNMRKTPSEELKIREAICLVCEMNSGKSSNELDRCNHKSCGCKLRPSKILSLGLAVPSKLEFASEKCPLGYWGPV